MDIEEIKRKIREGRYEISKHAEVERRKEGLDIGDVKSSIYNGKIIEEYPDDPRNSSCLVFGFDQNGIPIHSVCAFLKSGKIRICTVYIPNEEEWIRYQTRKRKR
ncbi:MAG: DUF4258 domain-containing protein [bacterium]|nr:DUF4258 domain-containing protein [bacterium]